jgi:cytochrome c-type biogenesis protein CcmE
MNNEPTLEDIEDYNNNESPQKRKTVKIVVAICLIVGAIFAIIKYNYNSNDDYVGTPEKPGINTTKSY